MKNLTLVTETEKSTEFLLEMGNDFLERVRAGKVKAAIVLWKETSNEVKSSQCSPSCDVIVGMLAMATHGILSSERDKQLEEEG